MNTIGAFRPGDELTTTPETARLMIDVNLGPALWLSQAVAPHMRPQGSGVIVHVAGGTGHYLNRSAEFQTSVIGVIRAYAPTVHGNR